MASTTYDQLEGTRNVHYVDPRKAVEPTLALVVFFGPQPPNARSAAVSYSAQVELPFAHTG